jgi:hypothetical protein
MKENCNDCLVDETELHFFLMSFAEREFNINGNRLDGLINFTTVCCVLDFGRCDYVVFVVSFVASFFLWFFLSFSKREKK